MPSTSLCGVRLRQVSNDFMPFYVLIAVVQVVWLFIYWIGIVAFARPESCDDGTKSSPEQWPAVFVMLALFIAQAAGTCTMALLTLRGTPLEPSKRRWVDRLFIAFLISLPINAGVLAWAAWVVLAGDGSCWSSGSKSMPDSIVFGGYGVILGQAVGFVISYNQLGDVRESSPWWARLTRTGLSSIIHLAASYGARYRGPTAQLEMVLTELQQRLGSIQADKSDAAATLVCAMLLQDEAAAGQPGGQPAAAPPGAEGSQAGSEPLLAWAQSVCEGAATAAAPQPAGGLAPAGEEAAAEALHWARFAAAAYGARQHGWRRGKTGSCAASKQLSQLAAAAKAEGAQPLAGWGGLPAAAAPGSGAAAAQHGQPSRAERKDFAAARELLGAACQIVAMGGGDRKAGLPAHLLAVDREKRAVVLGVAGNWRRPHAEPDAMPTPDGWLDGCASAAAEQGDSGTSTAPEGCAATAATGPADSWVHGESLAAANALLQELERSQLLQQLLLGPAAGGSDGPLGSLDCSGWQVVVAGHGVGAGAAALLAPKLAAAQLGQLSVWAFGPPGELCSPGLAASLAAACRLTVVALGDDAAPRTSEPSVAALLDQGLVGLARLRYPKMGLLAALAAERLGPKRLRGRWSDPKRALRPLAEAPPEALEWLQRYYAGRPAAALRSSLPGRVLLLSRVQQGADPAAAGTPVAGDEAKPPAVAAAVEPEAGGGSSSSSEVDSPNGSSAAERWQASWASSSQVAAWGIRSSRTACSDHYVSRLLGVLSEVAAAAGSEPAPADADASVADSRQPLQGHHAHKHSD